MNASSLLKKSTLNLTFILSLVFINACGESNQSSQSTDDEKESKQYSLVYTDIMEFTRGVEASYEVSGDFANDENPRITIDGLPEGAEFVDGTLTWNPSCELSPENGQFIRGYMVQRLRINYESSVTGSLVQKPAIIILHKDGPESSCKN